MNYKGRGAVALFFWGKKLFVHQYRGSNFNYDIKMSISVIVFVLHDRSFFCPFILPLPLYSLFFFFHINFF